jgi:geranylgeranyl pyrophosphate synthase
VLENGRASGVTVATPDGERLVRARCVVAADGATSRMRRECGIGDRAAGSPVYAVRQYFDTAEPLDPVFDVYVPLLYDGGLLAGYGWVFPIDERRANVGVAYYLPPAGRPRARIRRVLSSFVRELREREEERFGGLGNPTRPFGAPIAVQFSPDRCELGNVLFAGEAAATADPLTGEGISFAMRSGRGVARAADRMLRESAPPEIGRWTGREMPRLGQNLSLLARVAAGVDGFDLAENEHQPFVLAVRRVTGSAPDEPVLGTTEISRALEWDPDCSRALDRVNDRLLDSLRTTFPFGLETLHREVRAHGGPLAAACTLAVARASGDELGESAVRMAEVAELIALVDRCIPRMSAASGSDLAWLNNSMAVLLGDLALTAGLRAPSTARGRCATEIGAAIRAITEGVAIEMEDRYDSDRTAERCRAALDTRAGAAMSLAAKLGAIAAGAEPDAHGFARFGHELGIAHRIGEDIRELTLGDELTRRRPGSDLREGFYSLPVVTALDVDWGLRDRLGDRVNGREVGTILARIRAAGSVQEATHECRRHAEWALESVSHTRGSAVKLLATLARFPTHRIEGLMPARGPGVGAIG